MLTIGETLPINSFEEDTFNSNFLLKIAVVWIVHHNFS